MIATTLQDQDCTQRKTDTKSEVNFSSKHSYICHKQKGHGGGHMNAVAFLIYKKIVKLSRTMQKTVKKQVGLQVEGV